MATNFKRFRLKELTVCLLAILLHFHFVTSASVQQSTPKSYVVYMGSRARGPGISTAHLDKLTGVIGSSSAATDSLMYSYDNFDAFAARLTPEQAASLAAQEDVIAVFPNKLRKLHTTHSWSYLGLEDNFGKATPGSLWTKSGYGKDVIIGVIDTGVWPESESFNDAGLGPIPAKWKGECTFGELFGPSYCNKKLIGGQSFYKGYEAVFGPLNTTAHGGSTYRSARGSVGHGTHTSSTAGGNFAPGASLLGFAQGTAKGGAPMARVAMYKVFWQEDGGAFDADITAAFDKGISDGVDVFSISLGGAPSTTIDALAMSAFHAVQHNISVVASAGNDGPTSGTVSNAYPWMTTVAASSIDRSFPSMAKLGNGASIHGHSVATETLMDQFYPLVSAADVYVVGSNPSHSSFCQPKSLDPSKVSGKIVVCLGGDDTFSQDLEVQNAGGVGLITVEAPGIYVAYTLPAVAVTDLDLSNVLSYINFTQFPVAKISGSRTSLAHNPAPQLSYFSSRGPNTEVPNILKPDVAAPGYNILAAWSQVAPLSESPNDTRRVAYTLLSGTSMACPHVSGTIASLKAYHPTWSPAALHSAIVTTATIYNNVGEKIQNDDGNTSTPFDIGSGELNPNGAAEPGLVYDNPPSAYYQLLCSMGLNDTAVKATTATDYKCPAVSASVSDFNYPSLTVSNLRREATVKRTVTNVGNPTSTYTVSIQSPPGIKTVISPSVLKFSALGEELSFTVKLTKTRQLNTHTPYHFGSFTWSDGKHNVRSPLVVGI